MENSNILPRSYGDHLKFDILLNYIMYHEDTDFISLLPSLTYNSFEYNSIKYKFTNGQCTIFDIDNNIITTFNNSCQLIDFIINQPDEEE